MAHDLVTLEQLAQELGCTRSNARKIALQHGAALGFVPVKRQMAGVGRYQRVLTWSRREANQILQARKSEGFLLAAEQ